MSGKSYKLVFTGEVSPGQDIEKAKETLATILKLNAEQVAALFTGKRVVVRKGVDTRTARKFEAVFHKAGAILKVEPLNMEDQSPPDIEVEKQTPARDPEVQKSEPGVSPTPPQDPGLASSQIDSEDSKSMDFPAIAVFVSLSIALVAIIAYMVWQGINPRQGDKGIVEPISKPPSTSRKIPPVSPRVTPKNKRPRTASGADSKKAYEKAERIPLSISRDFVPVRMATVAMGSNQRDPLPDTPPKDIVKEPEYRGKSQRYGKLMLGTREEKAYYYVFDLTEAPHPVLYFDKNQNLDLTDDGPPLENQGSGYFATTITLPMGQLIKELDTTEDFRIWFFTNQANWSKGYPRHYSQTQMKGRLTTDNKTYLAYIAERGINDADFTNDGIYLDLNGNGKIEYKDEFIGNRQVALIDDKEYRFDIGW